MPAGILTFHPAVREAVTTLDTLAAFLKNLHRTAA